VAGADRGLRAVEVDHVLVDETLLLVRESHSCPRIVVSCHGPGAETEKPRGRAASRLTGGWQSGVRRHEKPGARRCPGRAGMLAHVKAPAWNYGSLHSRDCPLQRIWR